MMLRERGFAFANSCSRYHVLQAWNYLNDPNMGNAKRYGQFPVVESINKWATKNEDMEVECIDFLEHAKGLRTELWMFPAGFISPLEMDRPLFQEKTMFLLEGEVCSMMLREHEFAFTSSHSRNCKLTCHFPQMDVMHWNQHPMDVTNALPHSRRHASNLSAGLLNVALSEARANEGYIDSIEAGMFCSSANAGS